MWLDSNLPQAASLPLLDSKCPVGMYNEEHAYDDTGENIIHAYVPLLQIRLKQSDGNSYSEQKRTDYLDGNQSIGVCLLCLA